MNKLFKIYTCLINLQYWRAYFNLISPLFEFDDLIKNLGNIDKLVDVGSNKGQLGLIVRNYNPNCKIYSFEPQKEFLNLQKKLFFNNSIFFNLCLGSKNFNTNFNITNRKDSSSLLKPIYFNNTKYKIINKINVKVRRLDNLIKLDNKKITLMKLDVQGYEMEVLQGSTKFLKNINYLIIEISSQKIYHNQKNYKNIFNFLIKNKFKIVKIFNKNKINKKIFQKDVLFKKITI